MNEKGLRSKRGGGTVRRTVTHRAGEEARARLVRTALFLFAKRGVASVSARDIHAQAGCRNASALHYHFGSKAKLVEAVFAHAVEPLRRSAEAWTAALEAKRGVGLPCLRDVLRAVVQPFWDLHQGGSEGRARLRFLSRVQLEDGGSLRRLVGSHLAAPAQVLLGWVVEACPDVPVEVLRLRLSFFLVSLLHGFATVERLETSVLGSAPQLTSEELLDAFLSYSEAGLQAPVPRAAD